jgi:chitin disaccharide deacetylase
MKLSFVLPMYNEALNIEPMVEMIRQKAAPLLEDYEIIIVNDSSTDGCGEIADRMAREDQHIRVVHHEHNRGLGGAIRSGFAAAQLPFVLYSDSDLPVDFACLEWVLPQVTPQVDLLIGYRLGRAEGPRRAVMSWVYNRLIRLISGLRVKDVNFAFKIFRREFLERFDLRSEGSFIDAEILLEARRMGCRLAEVGIQYHTRVAGVSSLSSMAVVIKILRELLLYLGRDKSHAFRGIIINGDDFGLHHNINQGMLLAHTKGGLTSASLLAAGEAFNEAVEIARQHPQLEIGVHLTLTQIKPCASVDQVPVLVNADGHLPSDHFAVIKGIVTGRIPEAQIETEFRAQIERVRATGLLISHLDSHQHLHVLPRVAQITARLAREYGIPALRLPREHICWPHSLPVMAASRRFVQSIGLRLLSKHAAKTFRRAGLAFPDRFKGFVNAGHMQRDISRYLALPRHGITEIGCHPGASTTELAQIFDWGYHWQEELAALCEVAASPNRAQPVSWYSCRPRERRPLVARLLTGLLKRMIPQADLPQGPTPAAPTSGAEKLRS